MSMDENHLSPTVTQQRPRPHSRGISFSSNKSGSSESRAKYQESPQDKARRDSFWKGGSKANPNAAINEEQPGEANVHEQSTMQNIRDYQHVDTWGNPITDPDLTNPTRPRLERPLDTIRAFEKAIDDGYKRRSNYVKQDSEQWDQSNQFASRRNSYFSANGDGPSQSRFGPPQGGGYYGNGYGGGAPPSRMRYGNRMQSDPSFYGQQRGYPHHNHHQSYDTVNTGGSDSTGPWANSTDPSSENSSLDRVNAMNKDPYGQYPQNGYNGPIMEEQGQYGGDYNQYGQAGAYPQQNGQYPPRPDAYGRRNTTGMENGGPRRPIPLTGGPPPPSHGLPPVKTQEPEKRKSRLSRMFGKNKD